MNYIRTRTKAAAIFGDIHILYLLLIVTSSFFVSLHTQAQSLDVSSCPSIVKRSNGNGQASSAAGDFRPQSTQNNPVAPNVTGTKYQLVPVIPTTKTGDIYFKWNSGTTITNIPVISRVWLSASASTSGALSNIYFGPPGPVEISGNTYYVDYAFYNNNLPNQGILTLEFTDPQTNVPAFYCSYDLSNHSSATANALNCAPTILKQPIGQVVCGASTAKFFVEVSGASGYQWQESSNNTTFTNITNGVNYSGATLDTLRIANPQTNNGKYYRVVLASVSCGSTTSSSVGLTANAAPTAVFNGAASLCGLGSRSLGIALTGTAPWSVTYTVAGSPVTVNNISASPYFISVAPASATTFTLTSVSDAYCSNTSLSGGVSVTVNNRPTVTPANALVCIGSNSFGLSYTSSGTPNLYSMVAGTRALPGFTTINNATLNTSPITVSIPTSGITAGVYDFKMVVKSTTGCISDTVPFTLTVNSLPTVSASASASSVCAAAAVTLTAAPANLASYSWSSSPSSTIASVFNPTVNPTANTTYTVTGTNANGCSSTANVSVTITSGPTLSITPSSPTICNGNSTSLTASGGSTYSWSPSTNLSATSGASVIASPTTTTTYTVTSANASGCSSVGTVTVTVTSPTIAITNSSPTVCSGSVSTLTATAGFTTYAWYPTTGLYTDAAGTVAYTGTSLGTLYAKPTATTTYTVVGTTAGGCNASSTSTVTLATAPIDAVTSTGSGFTFCATGTSSFSVLVNTTITPTSMTWSYSLLQGGPYTSFTGAVSPSGATFTPSSTGLTNATLTVGGYSNGGYGGPRFLRLVIVSSTCTYNYDIQLFDTKGGGASFPAPVAAQSSICSGASTVLNMGTIGSGLTLVWQNSTDNITFTNITGATAATYTTPALTANTYYKVVISGSGSCGYTTGSILITVSAAITTNTVTPATSCSDGSTFIALSGTAITGGIYQWQRSTTSSTTGFTDLTGATSQNYTLTRNLVPVTTYYRRLASTSTCNANTSTAVVIYAPITNNTFTAGASTFCGSSTATLLTGSTPVGGDGTYVYLWQQSTDNSSWATASGTSTAINYTTQVLSVTTYYRRQITSGGCATSTSPSLVITINANPTVSIAASSTTICGLSTTTLTASGASSYSWSPSTYLSATTGSSVIMTAPNATSSTSYTVTGTNSATGCSAVSPSISISYTALPSTPTISTASATICSNGAAYNLNSIVTSGGSYEWFMAPVASATYLVAAPTSVSQAGVYYLFAKSGSCYSSAYATFTLTINNVSAPVVNGTAISLCSPATADLTSLQPIANTGTILEWHTGSTSGTALVSSPSAAGSGTYYLFAKSTAGNCYGPASSAVTITINALPAATVSGTPASVCFPNTVNLNSYNTTVGSNTYQWYTVASNPSPATLVNNPAEVTTSANYYVYATSTAGCKGGASAAVAVTINSKPSAVINAPATVCAATVLNITTSTDATSPTYTWQVSANGGNTFSNISNGGIYSGATSATLTINNSTGLDGYQYRYTVTSSAGCLTTSYNAIVSVDGIATISSQPTNYSTPVNGSAVFKISTSGTPTVNYQWKVSTDNGVTYNNLSDNSTYSGTTTPDLVINTAPAGFNGYKYICQVSNNCTAPVLSSAATLSVNTCVTPSVGGTIAGSTTVCAGTNATTLTLSGSTGVILNWQSSTNNFATDPVVINNTTTSLTVTNLTATTQYRAVVQSGSCATANSTSATITVNPNGQWIGGANGDWNNAANWCGGIPTTPVNVSIPAGSTVTVSTADAYANNLSIATGGSLVLNGTGNLIVTAGATFTNNGTFDASASTTGKVSFSGTSTIAGTSTFKNIETYGALNVGTATTITGNFVLQPGGSLTGNSPFYSCPGSALIYRAGAVYVRGLEWTSASTGAGYPSNVYVQNNTTLNFPVVGPGFVCNDLIIDNGSALNQNYSGGSAPLTVTRDVIISGSLALGAIEGGDISLGRNWTRSAGGVFSHNNRKVNFIGSNNSVITAPILTGSRDVNGAFGGETFYKLGINKSTSANTVTLGSHISVVKELQLLKGNFDLSNSDVTVVSKNEVTAAIAAIPSSAGVINGVAISYSGTGKFVIQRHLAIGTGSTSRRWRMLTAPLQPTGAPTVNQAWQEGVSNADKNTPIDPWPGFGTTITKSTVYDNTNGYDQGSTNNASLYYPTNTNGSFSWAVLPSTNVAITNNEGYMLFARGNRSIVVSTPAINASSTILEPKGRIITGDVQKTILKGYQLIGNPYASAINFGTLAFSNYQNGGVIFNTVPGLIAGAGITYYIWDPKTSGGSNVGKWITCSSNGDGTYAVTANSSGLPVNGIIQSGAAFMMGAELPGGVVTFHETDKDATSTATGIASRETGSNELASSFASTLLVGTGSTASISEGVINAYHFTYHNEVDGQDAAGFSSFNTADGLRIKSQEKYLAVERRSKVAENDTIFLTLQNISQKAYTLQFKATDMLPGINAILQDKFTGAEIPVSMNDTTVIPFNVTTDANSAVSDRFRIVFKKSGVLPISFSDVSAAKHFGYNAIQWKVDNEDNINLYEVEKSGNGTDFIKVNTTKALSNNHANANYTWLDYNNYQGNNYYRIKSIAQSGAIIYSKIVRVYLPGEKAIISIYPNPVRDGEIRLQLMNMAAGDYKATITNNLGQVIETITIKHPGGGGSFHLKTSNKLVNGNYNLEVSSQENFRQVLRFLVQGNN